MIDLNELPLEENSLDIEKEGCNIEEEGECKSLDLDEPLVGQCFLSEEEAFAFYQNYAKRNGFAIRKGRFVNKNGEKSRRDFFCHREGKPKVKMVDYSKQQRNRGCTEGGLYIRQIMRVMELEKSVRHGELEFLRKDVSNFIIKNHKLHSKNDARELLEYCKNAKIENSNFQYAFKLDADNRLQNIFWFHAHCFDMYQEYGDVVVFDTTYKVNSYDMPFGIFVGVDNHGRTILFGCAILRDKTTNTFEWLFKIKSFWVPAYLREFFFGGMTTTGRSESINAFIKKFISSRTCLSDFIRQVDLAVEDIQQKQIHDTMLQKYKGSYLRSLSPLEEQGYYFLAPFSFKKFQEQFGLVMQYSVEGIQYSSHEEKTVNFIFKHQTATKLHNVIWDGKVAKCTCKNFEFVGILYRHILSVFIHEGCFEVPSNYWHPRWGRKDTQGDEICSSTQEVIVVDSNTTFNDQAIVDAIDLVQCPIKSKTKGRPKQKRMKSGKELAKQRRCGYCRGFGHNINTCKERQVDDLNDASSQHSNKKKKIDSNCKDVNPILSKKC
ncbi:protein FAR1-RELATED SEQUENCE 11-like [Rutidosis leptorrhynchoides]|uniref:protein FAR1-RELATED SEQUENCE 11-like n=1 Tax=Rutidosis leptorrhynchoides TaxID=125765 RepID=UPI003A9A00B6